MVVRMVEAIKYILANRSTSKPITYDDHQVSVSRNSMFNVKTSSESIFFFDRANRIQLLLLHLICDFCGI